MSFPRLLRRAPRTDPIVVDGPDGPIAIEVRPHPTAKRLILRLCRKTGQPQMTLPAGVRRSVAETFATSRADWIAARLADAAAHEAPADGVVIRLRDIPHVIRHRPGLKGAVRRDAERREIVVPGDADGLERRLRSWLKRQAKADLETAVARYAAALGVRAARVSVRDTTSRWGSCAHSRALSFSWRLVMAPPFALDYVAAHEVAHLRQMNHGPEFWALVAEICPDTDRARRWLSDNGPGLYRMVPGAG